MTTVPHQGSAPQTPTRPPRRRPPGALGLGLFRGLGEVRAYARNRAGLIFNLALPLALMLLFGTLFKAKAHSGVDPIHDVVVAGVLASGIISTALGALAMGVTLDADDGSLRRLRGTPMPMSAYLIGKVVLSAFLALLESVLVLAAVVFRFHLPTSASAWLTFVWVFLLGISAATSLGVGLGLLATNPRSASGVIQFPLILLQFISGVYYSFSGMPKGLQYVGAVFPLKWTAQGMRSALLPASLAGNEPAGSWEHGRTAIVLGAWTVGGFLFCMLAQRWRMRRDYR